MLAQRIVTSHTELYLDLTDHFSTIIGLKSQLETLQRQEKAIISQESSISDDSSRIWVPSTEFQRIEEELVITLEQKCCTPALENLLIKAADTALEDLVNSSDFLHLIKNWTTPISPEGKDHSRSAIRDLHISFFNEASFHANYNFPIPKQIPYIPNDKKQKTSRYGVFTKTPNPEIRINVYPEFFNNRATRFANNIVHEATHGIQSHMADQLKSGRLSALLKPMLYDAIYWNLKEKHDAYIQSDLSYNAYIAQPTEAIARKIGFHIQKRLEKIMVERGIDITTPIDERAYLPPSIENSIRK